ncbi:MAG: AraC family transcriptional regulator [Anaerolineales bacterium]|nr:AraC family transcriptional regulator [Anaerolineales bacterium]
MHGLYQDAGKRVKFPGQAEYPAYSPPKSRAARPATTREKPAATGSAPRGSARREPVQSSDTFDAAIEVAMSVTVGMLNRITHQVVYPAEATFSSPRPEDLKEHKRILQAALSFNEKGDTLIYDRQFHEVPVTFSNPALHALFDKHAHDMLAALKKKTDLSSQVKMAILDHLREDSLSLQMVAEDLYMSPRTLQRKLEREGASFQALLDEVRQELAEDYLVRLGMSVSDTSFMVGLSEPSAFVRSFKRWTGLSPKEYQIQHRQKVSSL